MTNKFKHRKTGEIVSMVCDGMNVEYVSENKGGYLDGENLVVYTGNDKALKCSTRKSFNRMYVELAYHCGACSKAFASVDELVKHLETCTVAKELTGVLERMRHEKQD